MNPIMIDASEIVTITRLKNGRIKIDCNAHNKSNIYKTIQGLGFRKSRVGNKTVYFVRQEGRIIPVRFIEIRHAFLKLLREADFSNIPSDISGTKKKIFRTELGYFSIHKEEV